MLALLGVLREAVAVTPFGHTESEFVRFMSHFSTTKQSARLLSYEQDNVSNTYDVIKCDNVGMCPDGTLKNTCQWQRFFAAQYVAVGGTDPVEIYIGTNGMPDHCYKSSNRAIASETDYDAYVWHLKFNVPYKDMDAFATHTANTPYVFTSLTTQNDVDF